MSNQPPGLFQAAVAAVIINERNETLITQRSFARKHHPGKWEIMTGRLNQGESFLEALAREAMEELNIELEPVKLLSTFHFFRGLEKVEHLGVNYLCRIKAGAVKVDGVEEIACRWVNLDEALKTIEDESIRGVLTLVKAELK
ncbi:MAG: NUDIX domain-containing protein [bacterium]